ncbi:hypothetical protein GCM10007854_17480 [Algimonas porphyrae]|uniref:histidine kinase n=1 Tax=Algimonas porphyrae TaxID=1128113 RepID=A0ABQ5UZR4_9PROT|nr:hypothetical protein GCM10007854_17480 [Algimonas porphyrae]
MTLFARYLWLSCLFSLCCVPLAQASDRSILISDAVVDFFSEAEPVNPVELSLRKRDRLGYDLMNELIEALVNADKSRIEAAVETARAEANAMSPASLRILDFSETVLTLFDNENQVDRFDQLRSYFQSHPHQTDWYIESIAESLTAFTLVSLNDTVRAAEHLDQAMHIIPTELSDWATSARLLASEVAMTLHGLQGNPVFMLDAARTQRKAKAAIGETLNRYELMTNFVYAFNRVRDFESAAQVAELMLIEPQPENMIEGLGEVYVAQTFVEVGRYAEARDLARQSLAVTKHPQIRRRAHYAHMLGLAGLGREAEARAIMTEQGWVYSRDELLNDITAEAVIHAEALIAMHREDSAFALALMKRRTDLIISRVQNSNSANMTALLSSLENTQGRQLEREDALAREAALKAVQLEQQTKMNRLLWVLLAVLTIAFNMLLAFLRYREKLSRKVQALQKDALSAEKMKTEFLGIVNHELRTPLNGIIGISDAMIHNASDPTTKAQAEAVQESGQLLFDLLDSLITMSTIEGNRLALAADEADLSRTITAEAKSWEPAAEQKNVAFSHYVAPEVGTLIVGDQKRIRQCVRFLLSNAVRFTHEGRIHLHATAEPDGPKHMALSLVVADTGQGISEAVQERMFKPFLQADSTMTRKYGGAGLSLAIARKLARMMDGDLTVTSREGRGSEFHFTARLPRADAYEPELAVEAETMLAAEAGPQTLTAPAPAGLDALSEPEEIIDLMLEQQLFAETTDVSPARLSAQGATALSSLTLLVGDDLTLQTSEMRAALKSMGCQTVAVDQADQLIEQLERKRFDVVILNLHSPALGGRDTAARIRQLPVPAGQVPLIALARPGQTGVDADDAMFDHVLTHPVTKAEIEAALSQIQTVGRAA